jgi:hypothetical protein
MHESLITILMFAKMRSCPWRHGGYNWLLAGSLEGTKRMVMSYSFVAILAIRMQPI